MMYQYLNFFIGFQIMCSAFAVAYTISNTIRYRGTPWFTVYCVYLAGIAIYTVRRIIVLIDGNPAATTDDAMIWQTIISMCFLVGSAMAYKLLHHKK